VRSDGGHKKIDAIFEVDGSLGAALYDERLREGVNLLPRRHLSAFPPKADMVCTR
jgi:hypothetical protein